MQEFKFTTDRYTGNLSTTTATESYPATVCWKIFLTYVKRSNVDDDYQDMNALMKYFCVTTTE